MGGNNNKNGGNKSNNNIKDNKTKPRRRFADRRDDDDDETSFSLGRERTRSVLVKFQEHLNNHILGRKSRTLFRNENNNNNEEQQQLSHFGPDPRIIQGDKAKKEAWPWQVKRKEK